MIPKLWLRFAAFLALCFRIPGLPLTKLTRPSYDVQWSVSIANDGCVAPTAIGYDVDDVLTAREENNRTLGERLLLPQFAEFLAAKTAVARNPNVYEALFEAPIRGTTRSGHRASANTHLANQLQQNADLANMMNRMC